VFFEIEEPIEVVFLLAGDGNLQFVARDKERSQGAKASSFDFDQPVTSVIFERMDVIAQIIALRL